MEFVAAKALAELTSAEIERAVAGKTLIWPIGGIEQHGPHLPLNVDSLIPEALSHRLAAMIDGFYLPVQPFSARSLPQSGGGLLFPGTIYIDGATFTRYLQRTLAGLCRLPFKRLVIINGHYENEAFIFEAIDELNGNGALGDRAVTAFSWWSLVPDAWIAANLPEFPGWHAEHAGITETSLMLYLHPDLVRSERPDHPSPPMAGIYRLPLDRASASTQGVLSRTTGSSATLGKQLFNLVMDQMMTLLEHRQNDE
ncbi:creatininase family protein [Sodalis sp. dw_96]|uniref:creatininase family protein n=1 Tax=Sodalis sp. dw_96 TaxID=2719794 RepID=UPI001BD425F6|nr:creatininase family protein [Sodalis sp. dw_96]